MKEGHRVAIRHGLQRVGKGCVAPWAELREALSGAQVK